MQYRIGIVADLLGISPEGLRLYERSGILDAQREAGGSYRKYGHLDITALIRARSYHNCGFSLKQTQSLLNSDDLSQVQSLYEEKLADLEQELVRKQATLSCLQELHQLTCAIPQLLGSITRCVRPELYRLEFMAGDQLLLTPGECKEFGRWVDLTPFSFPAQRTSWQALLEGRDESVSAIGIFRQYAELFGLPLCSRAIRYEATSCLYTVVQLCGEQASATEYLAPLLAYVQEHGLTVTGDPIARTFLSMNKRNHYTRYRQIWLPIQETKKSP